MNLIKEIGIERFVLFHALVFVAIYPSLVTALTFASAAALYAYTRFLETQTKKANDDVLAQVKALKERIDAIALQRTLGK